MAVAVSGTANPVDQIVNKGTGMTSAAPVVQALTGVYSPVFSGNGWYVDATYGNDANPGTLSQPWKTLKRAASVQLAAGDALLLKCGEIWRDSLEITSKAAPAGNVLIGGYGDCSGSRRPVIRASNWVSPSNWSAVAGAVGPIYVKDYAGPVNRLFLDGKTLIKARFPNFKSVGAEFAIATAAGDTASFIVSASDLTQLASRDLVGATIYIRAVQWKMEKAVVKAFDATTGRVTLDRALDYPIQTGTGYILEGKAWMLDSPGEWFFDDVAKQLFLWAPGSTTPPMLTGLEASSRDYGLSVKWISNARVERISIEQANIDGLEMTETPDAKVTDVKVRYAQELGISLLTSPRSVVQDSTVEFSGISSIIARQSDNAQLLRNQISDNGMTGQGGTSEAALSILGNATLAEGNTIQRSAVFGIRYANRAGTVIRNNTVLSTCMRFTDCAGIYTYTLSTDAPLPEALGSGATVSGNMVMTSRSNLEGCGYSCNNLAQGIYMDELTTGVTITGNTVSDVEVGIGLLNCKFNTVSNNIVRNTLSSSLRATQTRSDKNAMRGNRIEGNSFFAHRRMALLSTGLPGDGTTVYGQYWFNSTNPALMFTGTNPNVVANNEYSTTLPQGTVPWAFANFSGTKMLVTAQWKAYAPTDIEVSRVTYRPYVLNTEPTLLSNGTFNAAAPAGSWVPSFDLAGKGGSLTVGSYAECGGQPCARFVPGSTSDYFMSNGFAMNNAAGQNLYVLKYTAIGGVSGGSTRAFVRRPTSPWDNFGLNTPATALAPGQRSDAETFFLANSNAPGVLDLRGGTVGSETFYANVSVQRVQSVQFADLTKLTSHVINPTGDPLGFPCIALKLLSCELVDETGAKVSWPLVVPARSSKTLFVKDPAWVL